MEPLRGQQARQEVEEAVILMIDGSAQFGSGRNTLIEVKDGRISITVRSVCDAWSMLASVAIDAIHFPPGTETRKETQMFRADVGRSYPLVLLVDHAGQGQARGAGGQPTG